MYVFLHYICHFQAIPTMTLCCVALQKPAHSAGIAVRFSRLGLSVLFLSCVLLAHTARFMSGPLSDGPEFLAFRARP